MARGNEIVEGLLNYRREGARRAAYTICEFWVTENMDLLDISKELKELS